MNVCASLLPAATVPEKLSTACAAVGAVSAASELELLLLPLSVQPTVRPASAARTNGRIIDWSTAETLPAQEYRFPHVLEPSCGTSVHSRLLTTRSFVPCSVRRATS